MIIKKIDTTLSIESKIQQIKFSTKNNQTIFREIVYPVDENLSEITQYIETSLPTVTSIEFLKSETGICFLKRDSLCTIKPTSNLIDTYWIDGTSYLIDYNDSKYSIVIFDSNLNKEKIITSFVKDLKVKKDNVRFIDELNNCWIKREV